MSSSLWLWGGFNVAVLVLLALDLGLFQRRAHEVSTREALGWSAFWITLALLFDAALWYWRGEEAGLAFLTGYLLEKSLSIDNIFVFVLIFGAMGVPPTYQRRVLSWGVIGALLMRGLLIAVGTALLEDFHWIIYVFGAFLIITGLRMALRRGEAAAPGENPLVRWARRALPLTTEYDGSRFFTRRGGRLVATPLLLVLLVVESTDLVFSVDSIPAIFSVTRDPFLVYTSNVFAVLGLRSLYFLLAGVMDRFYYLRLGLSAVLTFVGVKMALTDIYQIPIVLSLLVILSVLAAAVGASLWRLKRTARRGRDVAGAAR